ncbi:hypothetical protein GJ496_009214 [Pomphorhynchus laevis]|nr:hypothetical protein GJ496_009214 [Pomphorhynchus laevis]
MSLQPGHRHGSFKQKNKLHKSKHRSKRALTASGIKAKRVARPSCKKAQRLRKSCRRVKNKDKQKAKQSFLKDHKRFSILADIPIILTLFGISNRCPSELAINFLQEHYPMSTVGTNGCSYQLKIPKIRNTFQILVPNADVSLPCIDAIKVSESVLIVCNANDSIDDINEKLMELITLNCVQKCYVLIQGLRDLSPAQRRQQHQHLSSIFKPCLSKCNICSFDNPNDVFSLLQRICQNKPVHMPAREGRPYIVSEQCHLNLLDNELSITGIVRGNQLSINGLMYIPGVGSCQIKQIELIKPIDGEVGSVIFPDVNEQVKLPSYEPPNAPEPIKKSVVFNDSSSIEHVFVPEGTSDYQATWLQYPLEEDESSSIVDASVGSCVDEDDIDDEDLPMTIDDNRSESAFSTDSTKLKRQVTFADNVIFNNTDDESEMQSIDGRDMSYLKNARLELKEYVCHDNFST